MSTSSPSLLDAQPVNQDNQSTAPDLIFWIGKQGVFLDFYARNQEQLLLPPGDFLGRRIEEILPAHLAELTRQKIQQVLENGEALTFEYSLNVENGQRNYEAHMFRSRTDEIVAIISDTTVRKLNENLLYRQALTFATMFDAVILTDDRDLIIDWNPGATRMFGYERDEVIGFSPKIIHHRTDQLDLQNEIIAAIHRQGRWAGRVRFVRKDGAEGVADVIVVPLYDSEGRITATVGVNRDITERVRAEEILERREAILEAVGFAAEVFLKAPSWEKSIDEVLAYLGRASHVSRVYIFQNQLAEDGQLLMSQRYEWVDSRTSPQIDNPALQEVYYSEFAPRWEQVLKQGQPLYGLISTFPSEERETLEPQGILSIAVVPIFIGSDWWGYIGFDQCNDQYLWSPAELDALRAAASTLGAAIQREQAEKVHAATLKISEAVHQAQSLDDLYGSIHKIVSELMPAKNFYIALYDPQQDIIDFSYFVDEFEAYAEAQAPGKGLTEYVLRSGEPLLASPDVFDKLVASGEVELMGAPSIDWLGVPLKAGEKTFGVVVLQSYSQAVRFSKGDLDILTFVSHQIAMTIERKRVQTALGESEIKYRSLVETLPIGIYQVTPGVYGKILVANSAFMALFGIPSVEVLHQLLVSDLYEFPEERLQFSEMVLTKGQVKEVELRLKKLDGTPVWGAVTASVVRDAQGNVLYLNCLMEDITERKKRIYEREAVFTFAEVLRGAQTRAETLSIVVNQLMTLLDAQGVALILKEVNGEKHRVESALGFWEPLKNRHLPHNEPLCKLILTMDAPKVFVASSLAGSMFFPQASSKMQVMACAPLITHGQTTGLICIGRLRPISEDDLRLFGTLGDIASNAIYRATFYEQTQRQLQRLSSLRTIDMAIGNSMDLHLALNIILDHVTTQLNLDAADILIFNYRERFLELAVSRGFQLGVPSGRIRLGLGLASQSALERRTIISYNLAENDREMLAVRNLGPERFVSYCAIPLVAKGQVKGILEVFHRVFFEFQEDELDFLQTIAGEAAIAIDNHSLFSELQRSNTELSLAYDNTLEGWVRFQEYREGRPNDRARRLVEATVKLARLSGIPESDMQGIRRGALLHDIGKMALPDSFEQDASSPRKEIQEGAEALYRRHPQYAYDLLYPITYLRPALDIPFCHHENWDGTGYPRGLSGDQIPLSARIFSVVSAWDELALSRPDRYDVMDIEAVQALRAMTGKQLDPDLVERFLDMINAA